MKRTLLSIKLGLLMGLNPCAWAAAPTGQLFQVHFVKNPAESTGYLTVRPKNNHTYSSAGIKIMDPGYTLSGCKLNPANGYCMFQASNRQPALINIQRHNVSVGVSTALAQTETIRLLISLNAAGKYPISTQSVTMTSQMPGRMIGYLYGWETPPSADAIAAAHYTHVIITFGLFSTISSGAINIDSISGISDLASYVAQLQSYGIKVLLSIGGASTNIANTTVSFNTAEAVAPAVPSTFQTNFIASIQSLVTTYGFDGIDFDIEQGLYAGNNSGDPATDFLNPSAGCSYASYTNSGCTTAYLASIINALPTSITTNSHNPLLITLAPQLSQISATSTYNSIFGLYSALVMQTYQSLEWVAFQNYNSGCAYGINGVCYPTDNPSTTGLVDTQDPAVAFATDLLSDWPQGTALGFLPYTNYLTPSQVVIGYTVLNYNNTNPPSSDGEPPVNFNFNQAQQAIECLRSGGATSGACYTFVPPAAYPGIGGVFAWTINSDANYSYQFGNTLYPCVVLGSCYTYSS